MSEIQKMVGLRIRELRNKAGLNISFVEFFDGI